MNKKILTTIIASTIAMSANADDIEANGFVNLVYGISDNEATIKGIDDSGSLTALSSLGFDAKAKVLGNNKVSVGTRAVVRNNYEGDIDFNFDEAFLQYDRNRNEQFRIGKMLLPFHKYSKDHQVGYKTPFQLLPTAVYQHNESATVSGLSFSRQFQTGDVSVNNEAYFGETATNAKLNFITPGLTGKIIGNNVFGVATDVTFGNSNIFASYFTGETNMKFSEDYLLQVAVSDQMTDQFAEIIEGVGKHTDFTMYNVYAGHKVNSNIDVFAEAFVQDFDGEYFTSRLGYHVGASYSYRYFVIAASYGFDSYEDENGDKQDLQDELKVTASYVYSPRIKYTAEYTHINSNVNMNFNFDDHLTQKEANIFTVGMHMLF